jgi:integrase/recombinase XerC
MFATDRAFKMKSYLVREAATSDVKSETVQKYRDTSGIEASEFAKVLALIDRTTLKGKRDYAILRLLWDNALRRNEVCSLDVEDFNPQAKTLTIYGKGTGTQKTVIEITQKTAEALTGLWLARKPTKFMNRCLVPSHRAKVILKID